MKIATSVIALLLMYICNSMPARCAYSRANLIKNDISITVQDVNGKPVTQATFSNQSKNYTLPFDANGKLKVNELSVGASDEILITSVGYKKVSLTGKELLEKKDFVLTLTDETNQLKNVTISGTPEELKFKNIQELPFPLYYHACVTDKEFAYTIGGLSGTGISKQVLKYNPKSNVWSQLTNKIEPVIQATASYMPSTGKIYVIGGISTLRNFIYFEKVETIDVKTGEVKILNAKNPLPCAYSGSAVWNNKIYIFGGTPYMTSFATGQASNAFYEFDPETEKFTRLPDMPESVQTSGAVVDGILYVFGGYNASQKYNSDHIYAYDINRKSWEMIGKMPRKNGANGISTTGPLIFMTGGYRDEDFTGYLDTRTNKFTMIKSNLTNRRHSGAVILYNHLLVIGGADYNIGVKDNQVADLKELTERKQFTEVPQ